MLFDASFNVTVLIEECDSIDWVCSKVLLVVRFQTAQKGHYVNRVFTTSIKQNL